MKGFTGPFTSYRFEVKGEEYEISDGYVEEVRKNGQEDCHFGGSFWLDEETGEVVTEDSSRKHGEFHDHDIDAICAHLKEYGFPCEEEES